MQAIQIILAALFPGDSAAYITQSLAKSVFPSNEIATINIPGSVFRTTLNSPSLSFFAVRFPAFLRASGHAVSPLCLPGASLRIPQAQQPGPGSQHILITLPTLVPTQLTTLSIFHGFIYNY